MTSQYPVLITGGAGFIGSAVVRYYIEHTRAVVVNVDKLSYAGSLSTLGSALNHPRHFFIQADIADQQSMQGIFEKYQPGAVLHLAAESHVDRSIDGPAAFMQTNILGTYTLLDVAYRYWSQLSGVQRQGFRFLHVSTDEVYGSLGDQGAFSESSAYAPSSPYAASKAASDHLVRAWVRTYGFPALITHSSNNYGPYQFPEKLIPLTILNALDARPLPVYGQGHNVRDWLYVQDHVRALALILEKGRIGETYNVGAYNERANLEVVQRICGILDKLVPHYSLATHYSSLITFVADRPGHDYRYALDASKIKQELGWMPKESFSSGLEKTVRWYLENLKWCEKVQEENYQRQRLGLQSDRCPR